VDYQIILSDIQQGGLRNSITSLGLFQPSTIIPDWAGKSARMPSAYRPHPPSTTLLTPYNIPSSPAYSHITTTSSPTSRLITISGQVGTIPFPTPTNAHATHTPSDPVEQITQAFANLRQCLECAGATIPDILSLRAYIVNYNPSAKRQDFHRPLANFLTYDPESGETEGVTGIRGKEGRVRHKPAITLVPVPSLASPDVIFEVEAQASIPVAATEDVDVVVVGAGLSGLKAAWDLQSSLPSLNVVVLEARDRVGGKTWSRNSKTGKVDVGAAWINDTNQSYIWELVKQFQLEHEVVVQNIQGDMSVENGGYGYMRAPYGGMVDEPLWQHHVLRVRKYLEENCHKVDIRDPVGSAKEAGLGDVDDLTLEEFVQRFDGSEVGMGMVRISTRALLGVEPGEVSALWFLDYVKSAGGLMAMRGDGKGGGQYLRMACGEYLLFPLGVGVGGGGCECRFD
jgi:monoamine oxidase